VSDPSNPDPQSSDARADAADIPRTPLPDGYRMSHLDPADRPLIESLASWAFADATQPDEAAQRPFALERGRIVGIWHESGSPARQANGTAASPDPRGFLAATHASYAFTTFGVPGGTVPTAGLTWVGVHPEHRRRGLARAMVEAHLQRTAARGEPLSALFASEPGIYGRYGYGRASYHCTVTLGRRPPLKDVPEADELTVHVAHADAAEHGGIVRAVHDASTRPGWARRETVEAVEDAFTDLPSERKGAEPLRIAWVEDRAGVPRAYALFSRKASWSPNGASDGTATVREAVTHDGAAAHALWAFLGDLDLMVKVRSPMLAVDDPLLALLVDTRTVERRTVDNVWIRLVDLPAALRGRAYAAPLDVVLEVTDTLLPANGGRWRVRAEATGDATDGARATVTHTEAEPDLELDVAELATAYLGGVTLGSLGAAGLVRERTPGALAAASTAFGWPDAPVTSFVF
jgi:predicted acetyltransferase